MDKGLSKKERRLQNKKRKLEVFLCLSAENEIERNLKRQELNKEDGTSSSQDSSDLECKPSKLRKKAGKKHADVDGSCSTLEAKAVLEGNSLELGFKELRARNRARKAHAMERPKVFLRAEFSSLNLVPASSKVHPLAKGNEGSISDDVPPLFIIDMQHILLFGIEGNITSYKPRFCSLLRCGRVSQVAVIVANGLTLDDYQENMDSFPFLNEHFAIKVPLVSPTQYGINVATELFNVPLSESQIRAMRKEHDGAYTSVLKNLHRKIMVDKQQPLIPVTVKSSLLKDRQVANVSTAEMADESSYLETRVDLLLSPLQMLHERYPMPAHSGQFSGYVTTKAKYEKVTATSPLFAIDCEMCQTDKYSHELTWIAVVNENCEVVYESFVKPRNVITNYLTRFSGVTAKMLQDVETRIEDVQKALRELLPPDAILCGQSFSSDLKAMQMFHPYVIDTSVIYNLSGVRHHKPSLRLLAAEFLSETIQSGGDKGHSPVEDAITTMRLVKHKLEHTDVRYGDIILHNSTVAVSEEVKIGTTINEESGTSEEHGDGDTSVRRVFFRRPGTSLRRSLFQITKKCGKSVLFVDREEDAAPYKDEVDACYITGSDKETRNIVKDHMGSHMMAWIQLHDCARFTEADIDSQQKMLKKTDRHIRKMVSTVADKSMVIVIFPGRTDKDGLHDALGCIHIANTPR